MITEFKDEYRWLSNFEPVEVKLKLDLRLYPSVEHAYQAAKSEDKQWRKFCRETNNPGKSKKSSKENHNQIGLGENEAPGHVGPLDPKI